MTALTHHQGTAALCARGLIQALHDAVDLTDTEQREDGILLARDDHQLLGRDEHRQIPHVKETGYAGDVVAGAVMDVNDGIAVGTESTGGHEAVEAVLQTGGVVSGCAPSRIAHEHRSLEGDQVRKMSLHGVQHPHDVPDTLADEGASQQQGGHDRPLTGGTMLGTAAETEAPLLNGQSGKALRHSTDTEIAVTSCDCLLIPGVFGNAKGNMRALGVTLQANAEGQRPRLPDGQKQIGVGVVALLGLKSEMDMAVTVEDVLGGDLKNRLTGSEGVQPQQLDQPGLTNGAVLMNRGHTVPAQSGSNGAGILHMVSQRKSIHKCLLWIGITTIIPHPPSLVNHGRRDPTPVYGFFLNLTNGEDCGIICPM